MSHKIGITACSNPMHPSFSADLARLCQILRELGFDPVLSPCLYDNGSGFSGTGAERADAFMNLYCDPDITDIFDVSGGDDRKIQIRQNFIRHIAAGNIKNCLLYTSDAADEL